MSIFGKIWHFEPVVIGWALDGGLAAACAFLFHTTNTQTAAITTIMAGAVTLFTAWKTKEKSVSTIVGAIVTVATAASAFGLHLTAAEIGAGTSILSGLLALVLRANVSPAVTPTPVTPTHP